MKNAILLSSAAFIAFYGNGCKTDTPAKTGTDVKCHPCAISTGSNVSPSKKEEPSVAQRMRPSGILGRNRLASPNPVALFDESNMMPYDVAVEKARANNAAAYYCLAYYFARGEEVNRNRVAAWKFLEKSAELGCPDSFCAMGRLHEFLSFGTPSRMRDYDSFEIDYSGGMVKGSSFTNQVAVSYVEALYQKAIDGGLLCVTNDMARFHKKVENEKSEIVRVEQRRKNADAILRKRDVASKKALDLLPPGVATNQPVRISGSVFSKSEKSWTSCSCCSARMSYERTYKWDAQHRKWLETTAAVPTLCRRCQRDLENAVDKAEQVVTER